MFHASLLEYWNTAAFQSSLLLNTAAKLASIWAPSDECCLSFFLFYFVLHSSCDLSELGRFLHQGEELRQVWVGQGAGEILGARVKPLPKESQNVSEGRGGGGGGGKRKKQTTRRGI